MKKKVRMIGTSKGIILPPIEGLEVGEEMKVLWGNKVVVLIRDC